MEVKTSTKEKFHVIHVSTPHLSANMAAKLGDQLNLLLKDSTRNIVLNLKGMLRLDNDAGESLVRLQQRFYENGASFVVCELQPESEELLERENLLELMNVTPTESEAADIVQMEEIERELLGGED